MVAVYFPGEGIPSIVAAEQRKTGHATFHAADGMKRIFSRYTNWNQAFVAERRPCSLAHSFCGHWGSMQGLSTRTKYTMLAAAIEGN